MVALFRTKSASACPNATTYIDIEAYSIGFSALYFWIISSVFLSSIIGVSQTGPALPRILTRFKSDLAVALDRQVTEVNLPNFQETTYEASQRRLTGNVVGPGTDLTLSKREKNGGIYSWQPAISWEPLRSIVGWPFRSANWRELSIPLLLDLLLALLPVVIVTSAATTGWAISWIVPPVGWSCRNKYESYIYLAWLGSASLGLIPLGTWTFAFTFLKDAIAMFATVTIVIFIQVGFLNRCSCYADTTGIALPEMQSVSEILNKGLAGEYYVIVVLGLLFHVAIVPGLIISRFRPAMQVFLQRDDGFSNVWPWARVVTKRVKKTFSKVWQWVRDVTKHVKKTFSTVCCLPIRRRTSATKSRDEEYPLTQLEASSDLGPKGPEVSVTTIDEPLEP